MSIRVKSSLMIFLLCACTTMLSAANVQPLAQDRDHWLAEYEDKIDLAYLGAPAPLRQWPMQALRQTAAQLIVLPAQTQLHPVDSIARSLTSRQLGHKLKDRGITAADPDLIRLTLGSSYRGIDTQSVQQLAEATGINQIVIPYLGHTGLLSNNELLYTVTAFTVDDTNKVQRTFSRQWRLAIDAEDLPEELLATAIHDAATDIQRAFELPSSEASPSRCVVADLWQRVLQGAVLPESVETGRHPFFEDVLVQTESCNYQEEVQLIRAWAWRFLDRRPRALQALATLDMPGAAFLRAALDADIPRMEKQLQRISHPFQHLLTHWEMHSAKHYAGISVDEQELTNLEARYPGWGNLLFQRFHEFKRAKYLNEWQVERFITQTLGESVEPSSTDDWLELAEELIADVVSLFDGSVETEFAPEQWLEQAALSSVQHQKVDRNWLYQFELAAQTTYAFRLDSLWYLHRTQGAYEQAIKRAKQLKSLYPFDHAIESFIARSSINIARNASGKKQAALLEQYDQARIRSTLLAPGQTPYALLALRAADYDPRRHLSSQNKTFVSATNFWLAHLMDSEIPTKHDAVKWNFRPNSGARAEYYSKQRLRFAQYDATALRDLVNEYRNISLGDKAADVLTNNSHRFVGSAIRSSLLGELAQREDDLDLQIAQLKQVLLHYGGRSSVIAA